jgi:hypothetical protein
MCPNIVNNKGQLICLDTPLRVGYTYTLSPILYLSQNTIDVKICPIYTGSGVE